MKYHPAKKFFFCLFLSGRFIVVFHFLFFCFATNFFFSCSFSEDFVMLFLFSHFHYLFLIYIPYLNWSSISTVLGVFKIFLENFISEINIAAYSSFLCVIFVILVSMIKLAEYWTDFHQVDFYERVMYLQCLHCGTTIPVQIKVQDGNSVTEPKKFYEN